MKVNLNTQLVTTCNKLNMSIAKFVDQALQNEIEMVNNQQIQGGKQTMKKIINPIIKKTYGGKSYRVFVEIEYNNGNLSLNGVEGPLNSGNCFGLPDSPVDPAWV